MNIYLYKLLSLISSITHAINTNNDININVDFPIIYCHHQCI